MSEPTDTQSTTASSVSKPSVIKSGVSIAKLTVLNDHELERLLRFQFKKIAGWVNQSAIKMQRIVSYSIVDKHVQGPKIVKNDTVSRRKAEKEWEHQNAPSAVTYA